MAKSALGGNGTVAARSGMAILLLLTAAGPAMAQSIEGTATYRERMALPRGAVFEAVLEDVSRADAPAEVVASTRLESPGTPPFSFTIPYDPSRILSNRRYVVRARIVVDGRLLFASDGAPVLGQGSAAKVSLLLRRTGSGPATAPTAAALEGTYWRAIELAGQPAPVQNPRREAHLQFMPQGRITGSDGCNRVMGPYRLDDEERVSFGPIAATQMACLDASGTERLFRDALRRAVRLTVRGERLELFDASGNRLAAFSASRLPSASAPASPLAGTTWRLVTFEGGDDTTLTPDDRSKYTIEFAAGGALTARIDCNRGRGTWTSSGTGQLTLGPLALTRAQCPPGSLHDQIVKQWPNIRSYVIRNGHLFLALMADGGIYEFEPVPGPAR